MTGTADIAMINLQVYAPAEIARAQADGTYLARRKADPKAFIWQSQYQTIPMGTEDDPVGFAKAIRKALPLVNALRIPFNAWSFNPNGSLDPRFEAFLDEATKQGFRILFVYMDGEGQRFGSSRVPGSDKLTPDQVAAALSGEVLARAKASFGKLSYWLERHPGVQGATWGLELMNEPASFKIAMNKLPKTDVAGRARFVQLYAQVMVDLAKSVEERWKGNVLVGGFAYSADFNRLAQTQMPDGTATALDYIREGVGPKLIWSAHLYPGWVPKVTSDAGFNRAMEKAYGVLGHDALLLTETNAPESRTYNLRKRNEKSQRMAENMEWFADHGIGITWFTGTQKGNSTFVIYSPGQPLLFPNLDSMAAGMNAFSLGRTGAAIAPALIPGTVGLQKSEPAVMLRKSLTGGAAGIAMGVGGAGEDRLTGLAGVDNFLYGGKGNDSLTGAGPNDYIYGQDGNDTLFNPGGDDHLFGGRGNDLIVSLGMGYTDIWGGSGGDRFSLGTQGKTIVADYAPEDGDTTDFRGHYKSLAEVLRRCSVIDWDGNGVPDLLVWHDDGGYTIFLDMGNRMLDFARSLAEFKAPDALPTIAADQVISGQPFSPATGINPDGPPASARPVAPVVTVPQGPGRKVKVPPGGEGVTVGTAGDDEIFGRGAGDVIVTGAGNDIVHEVRGHNTIFAGDGNDTIETGRFASKIVAGSGDDLIQMDMRTQGSEIWSGAGHDRFEVTAVGQAKKPGQFAEAQIHDFDPARDQILWQGVPIDFAHLPTGVGYDSFAAGKVLTINDFARLYLYESSVRTAADAAAEAEFDPRFDPAHPARHLP
ncbi:MAG: calcium-binding protein [Paracoccaceae bacterium]|nr:calcium-binding protein [Paracoccaceae bacterium]